MVSVIEIDNVAGAGRRTKDYKLTFWCCEVKYIAILSKHVDFLNPRNWLHIQFFKSALKFFVVLSCRRFSFPYDFSAHSPLSTLKKCKNLMRVKIDDPDRTRSSPILLAAAAACSFAIFAGSMVGLGLGETCGLSYFAVVGGDEDENVQIRFGNKHMYTYTSFDLSHRRVVNPNVCNLSYQTGKCKGCGMHNNSERICIYSEIYGGRISCYSWSWILYVSTLSYQLKRQTSYVLGDIWERAGISQGYPRTCVWQLKCIWLPSSSDYRRISFAEIYSKLPSHMHCSHLPAPVKLLVNQLAWPCISSIIPHGQVDRDYT